MNTTYELATNRVDNSDELTPYRDLLIEYDWEEGEEHLHWVATAPVAELVAWAKGLRQDEHPTRHPKENAE